MLPETYKPILHGVVGSTAYNLNTKDSDIDTLGVYVVPTADFFRLQKPTETVNGHEPDFCFHELQKFIRLLMKGNPTVIEVLFMEKYLICEPEGKLLIDNRLAFLSYETVLKSYVGYVDGQLKRLMRRGDFGSDLKKRRAKHARHCYRLLLQAEQLITTGTLTLKLTDAQREIVFGVGEMDDETLEPVIEDAIAHLKTLESVLPDAHDNDKIEQMIMSIRFPKGYFSVTDHR